MSEEPKRIVLDAANAESTTTGNVTITSYPPASIAPGQFYIVFTAPGQIVSGGVHVVGWKNVYMMDSYPSSATDWEIRLKSDEEGSVEAIFYAVSITS